MVPTVTYRLKVSIFLDVYVIDIWYFWTCGIFGLFGLEKIKLKTVSCKVDFWGINLHLHSHLSTYVLPQGMLFIPGQVCHMINFKLIAC